MRIWCYGLTQSVLPAMLIGSTLLLVRASDLPQVTLSYKELLPCTSFVADCDNSTAALLEKKVTVAAMLITILLFPPDLIPIFYKPA